ncbi:3-deoxy-D-manno-octulosonic-acid transferase [Hydrobacter penzbergensis]|uniref:3-deoxy-D-manno-octulosonic acid transferase n=1 Tax=Hydrobacter penzbergensis TaxID=1235997 RepID=A0A8X8ICV6_9BACT|nr:glycosyltransferase N-terminal domain-containing protein [Hydrobacter penzbergensis]MBN8718528.1 3-deoxy-D-manno-octulosonic acid transferase [Sediminibacterium magnilacihabitans]PQV61997.1 3-deoxy-D-manno-octulosonic-acid transferase [Sediminibacterium magnilacihabitans]SDW18049.1 3-deoxy-D-manno-octulosonic-acid transferase [Hydrobacter penzbergensis]
MQAVYRLFIWIYPKAAWLLGLYNHKARLWVKGRSRLFKKLSVFFHNNRQPVVWMHTASLGEFEQGRPILERIRQLYPKHKILLSFFSPSGYEIRKHYEGADLVCYLPMDGSGNASRFLNIVQPSLVIFVKYEFWHFYLQETRQRNIPLLLVSGIFRKDQPFFQWYGGFHRAMLSCFTQLFVQNAASATLLQTAGFHANVSISGDTRFDRVIAIASQFQTLPVINRFCDHRAVIVAGSTWTDDDEVLDHFANTHPELRFIIAPHDIDSDRLDECLKLYKHAILYSAYEEMLSEGAEPQRHFNVLIIDNIGMLSKLYHYATLAYIGGGFGDDGIHNILEAAVYGKPVLFGPVYQKYFEAEELLDAGGAFSVDDALELEKQFKLLLENKALYDVAAKAALDYVQQHAGATQKIIQYIQANRLLTN